MNLKKIEFLLNFATCLIVIDGHLDPKTTQIHVANIVGRNMTLKLLHSDEVSDFEWQLIDIFTNETKTIDFNKSNELNIFHKYASDSSSPWHKYLFHFNRLTMDNSGKMLAYFVNENNSKKMYFAFSTIIFEDPICGKYKNNSEEEDSRVLEVFKNQSYIFSCSTLSKWNYENQSLAPRMSWDVEKQWIASKIFETDAFKAQYSTISKLPGKISKFSRFLEYTVPDNDLKAWEHNNHHFFCHIQHDHFYHKELHEIKGTDFITTVPISSKMPTQCKIQLNVQFSPFVHPNVRQIQEFNESYPALVECPIKANNHFPVKYYIVWYTKSHNSHAFNLKLVQEYIGSADIYVIENPRYEIHHNTLIKCDLYEIDPKHYHSEDYKKNIFLKFEKQKILKKLKLLFSSSIRIEITKEKWKKNANIVDYAGVSYVNVFVICFIECLVFFGVILFVVFMIKKNFSKKNSTFASNMLKQSKKKKMIVSEMNEGESVSDNLAVSFITRTSDSKNSWTNKSNMGATSSFFSESKIGGSVNKSANTTLLKKKIFK